ncbi:C4-dicarboxylate TRAP transporter large permease protein DctM [subsurface metagenome]
MSNEALIIGMFLALLFGLIFLGSHLGFMLGTVAILGGLIGWAGSGLAFFYLFPIRIYAIMQNYILVAVPLFVFMGYMLERSGFGENLFGSAELFFGRFRGGMAIMVVVVTTILAATTGIVATGVIMAGVLALPVMLRRGYNKGLALGTVAAGGTLGILIPPSIMLVFYASQTALSVGKLFLGAFGPGLLLSALFISYVIIITTIYPKMAPRLGEVPERTEYVPVKPFRVMESRHPRLRAVLAFAPIACLLAAVLGTIMFGIATPTEAAACGAGGAILIAAAYRQLNWRTLMDVSLRTFGTMGMFSGIVIGAMCFTAIFCGLGGGDIIYNLIIGLPLSPLGILLVILGFVFVLGMFIDWVAILLVLLPTMVPISVAMGWDQLWFGLVVCVTLQTAWLSPPFGYSLFFLRGLNMPGVTMADIAWGCVPFILLQLVGVGLIIAFPQIILWLPNLLIR